MQTGMRRVPIDVQPEVSVYYDAWSNDNDIDPMLSLVYEILQTVNTDYSFKKSADCLKIAAAIADFFTGKKVTTLVEAFTQTDRLAALKEQKSIHTLISEFLDSLLAEQGNRLVIFIDELDRCKPSYAVQLLERIKHYFSNERVTFVFSINTNELQHTVERYYGDDFDSCKYLDRFFDLKLSLPPINLDRYFNFIGFNASHYIYDVVSGVVIKHFHFEMREIAKYVRLTRIAGYSVSRDSSHRFSFSDGRGLQFCILSHLPTLRKRWQTLRRRGRKNRIRPRLSQTAKSVPTRRVLSRSAPDPTCGSRFKKSKRSGRPRSRSSPPVIKRGRPRTSSRRKTNIEKKEGKCNGELRQSVFKSAAVQRATL